MSIDDPEFETRRLLLVRALSAGALGALHTASHAQTLLGSRPAPLPPGRSFYRIRGEVTVDQRPATLETRVSPGSTVATGEDSEAIFIVGSQAMLLRARSQLILDPAPNPLAPSEFIVSALRLVGNLLSVSRDTPMRIQTPTATIGIRGTGWYAEGAEDQTYFCTCYGETEIESSIDPTSRDTVVSRQHDRPLYITREGPAGGHIRPAPFIDHTDQELALIEAIVGRTPPFVFPRDIYNAPRRTY
jgi:hypothetical protein